MTGLDEYVVAVNQKLVAGDSTEHTFRGALGDFVESFGEYVATNEPRRVAAGAPDFNVARSRGHGALSIGKIEAKDVGVSLELIVADSERKTPKTRDGEQISRYRAAFPNLILTNYVSFVWFRKGVRQPSSPSLGRIVKGRIEVDQIGAEAVEALLRQFLRETPERIQTARALAERMARLADLMREIVLNSMSEGTASTVLKSLQSTFTDVLLADLTNAEFADMFSQTIAYGLFAARIGHSESEGKEFTRQGAAALIPRTNPFLRRFFTLITGPDLDDEPYAAIVDDLVELLADVDADLVMRDFGSQRHDPIVHFYETFLAAYDPRLRDIRGVYYTPLPVVSFIVRSVDEILKRNFSINEGLADTSKVGSDHRVLVLDPACGTGTFLYEVINVVRERFDAANISGAWSSYIRDHLLPRLFGFEIMIAPYAVAHLKLGLELMGVDLSAADRVRLGYDFASGDRIGVFLTNALDPGHATAPMPLTEFVSDEANAAQSIKQSRPIMVVIGNPPYQGQSMNASERVVVTTKNADRKARVGTKKSTATTKGAAVAYVREKTWIGKLLAGYYEIDGVKLGERNPKWLQDDYVKFIRMGQDRIDRTGQGVLAFVTNHTFLDAPTFRGMRRSLLDSFDEIFVLDLHGSTRRREVPPVGDVDENVFDQIQQGVCVSIFIKNRGHSDVAIVHHGDLWGSREEKYGWLAEKSISVATWDSFSPRAPFYPFKPLDVDLQEEWEQGFSLSEIFPVNSTGLVTYRDSLVVDSREGRLRERIEFFCDPSRSDDEVRRLLFGTHSRTTSTGVTYLPGDNRDWKMAEQRKKIRADENRDKSFQVVTYRPFDDREIFYNEHAIESRRYSVMRHMLAGPNLALISARSNKSTEQDQFFVSRHISEVKAAESTTGSTHFPIWLYEADSENTTVSLLASMAPISTRRPNISDRFRVELKKRLGLQLIPQEYGDLRRTIGVEDVLAYVYAICYSTNFRLRFEPLLRQDYAHVPLMSDMELVRALCASGRKLIALHTLEYEQIDDGRPGFNVSGTNLVDLSRFAWTGIGESGPDGSVATSPRIYINRDPRQAQYFDDVDEEVWDYAIGGYQVLSKWLQARKGDVLTYDEIVHFARSANAIRLTLAECAVIDDLLSEWRIWQ